MKKILLIIIMLFTSQLEVYANSIEDKLNAISDKLKEIVPYLEKYPIGSIYMSTSSDNPSTIFGGTWQSYGTGRTLISAGGDYTVGATGGITTTTITTANIPSHTHTFTATATITSTFNGTEASVDTKNVSHSHTGYIINSGGEASGYGLFNGSVGFGGRVYVRGESSNLATSTSDASHSHTLTAAGSISNTFSGTAKSTSSVGSGTSFSVLNPYITVYIWKRIS